MKKIIILSNDNTFQIPDVKFSKYYEELSVLGTEKGFQFIRAISFDYGIEKKHFKYGEYYDGKKWCSIKHFIPDLVWYKGSKVDFFIREIEKNHIFISDTSMIYLDDKYISSFVFCDFMPTTKLLSEFTDNNNILKQFEGEKVVIKKIRGYGGHGVFLINKSDIKNFVSDIDNVNDYIIQQYVDFSGGVPGIIEGNHDVRFLVIGKEIPFITIRTPTRKDEFRCNLGQGGKAIYIDKKVLPTELIDMFDKINKKLVSNYGEGFYALDFGRGSNGKYFLIEINSSVGIDLASYDKIIQTKYFNCIINFFSTLV